VVDGLEQEMGDEVHFARVDINDDRGRSIGRKYGVRRLPTFIVLDAKGKVIYRKNGGRPEADVIRARLAESQ